MFDTLWVASNVSVAVKDGRIAWVGSEREYLNDETLEAKQVYHYREHLLTPGLIDCHTHLVYGGNRAQEFAMRLEGATYEEIAKAGGGILNTVKKTRSLSEDELYEQSLPRLLAMMAEGVTTVEIKSGYGLDLETELTMLRVAKRLGESLPVSVVSTFLGAHTLPTEYRDDADVYIDFLISDVLPKVKDEKLAQSCDIFCESIGFNLAQSQKLLLAAKDLGFQLKCHAEQLSNLGISHWMAKQGALSCDHLEFLDEEAIAAMKDNDTVAVLLPGAFYFLKETQKPPIELLRKHQVNMAIATDCNPGSSPLTSLPIAMNMACVLFGLTVDECWQGVTKHAAQALGLNGVGEIAVSHQADFCLWPFKDKSQLCYHLHNPYKPKVVYQGQLRHVTN